MRNKQATTKNIKYVQKNILNPYTGFGWDEVNSLHSNLYGAVLHLGLKQLVTNQCSTYCWTVLTQHQSLLCFSMLSHQQVVQGVQKKLGRDTARTDNPNWPNEYSIPYNNVFSNNSWGKDRGRESLELQCLSSHVIVLPKWGVAKQLPSDGK